MKGPLLVRVEVAGGRTANGGALLGDDGWVGGVRAGFGADTPVGPVRFEYGYRRRIAARCSSDWGMVLQATVDSLIGEA